MTTHNFLFPGEMFPLLVATLPIKSNQKRMHVIDLGEIVYINKDQSYPSNCFTVWNSVNDFLMTGKICSTHV